MQIAKLRINGISVEAESPEKIPCGLIGGQVRLEFTDPVWDGLQKTAVFRGAQTKDVLNVGGSVEIPVETLSEVGRELWVGICGTNAEGTMVIPTLWAKLGTVWSSADPSGDLSADPELPVWAQLLAMIGNVGQLETQNRESLVQALNELALRQPEEATPDDAVLAAAVAAYMRQNPPAPGTDGKDGTDGLSAYEIAREQGFGGTVAQWLESLQGKDGKNGADGKDGADGANGKDGIDGQNGADGHTPVKGVDYWTDADRESVIQEVIAALGTPVFGRVDADHNIILTGDLADGTYTLKYEDAQGAQTVIGTVSVGSSTNLADPASEDWLKGYRVNSSLNVVEVSDENQQITNIIPLGTGANQFHIKGMNVYDAMVGTANYCRVILLDADQNIIAAAQLNSDSFQEYYSTASYDSSVAVVDVPGVIRKSNNSTPAAYVRFGGYASDPGKVVITCDENIM